MTTPATLAALDAAAAAGPFFLLDTDPPPRTGRDSSFDADVAGPDGPPWRPFSELVDDPAATRARISAIREGIAERGRIDPRAVPARSAASLAHLGLISRVISPVLGAAVLGGVVPQLRSESLYWRDVLGPVPLSAPELDGIDVEGQDPARIAAILAAEFAVGPVAGLGAAIGTVGAVSPKVLWGNVASAVAGAARMLVTAGAPPAALGAIVTGLLALEPLTGTGAYVAGVGFRRTSCCLYYRVPGGGYCGDCVLTPR
ncbi:MAG: (2Fe-2S)-binding protein [Sporichthyaceae bacterium]